MTQALGKVLEAADRRRRELLKQAAMYASQGFARISDETIREHYDPLNDAVSLVRDNALTAGEIDALLWAVRNIDSDSLRRAQAEKRFGDGYGHGDLSSAANKIERLLGAELTARVPGQVEEDFTR